MGRAYRPEANVANTDSNYRLQSLRPQPDITSGGPQSLVFLKNFIPEFVLDHRPIFALKLRCDPSRQVQEVGAQCRDHAAHFHPEHLNRNKLSALLSEFHFRAVGIRPKQPGTLASDITTGSILRGQLSAFQRPLEVADVPGHARTEIVPPSLGARHTLSNELLNPPAGDVEDFCDLLYADQCHADPFRFLKSIVECM